jgi:hypothetical protein
MNSEPKKHPKPTSYDQLYPGRFIKAAELLGKKVTLTITDVELEDLEGDDGKKTKALVRFKESPKMLVICKTNGICIKEMFGKQIADWIGKRITIFEDVWNGEPCTRIWGSPDIPDNMDVSIQLPRRRPMARTLHKVEVGANKRLEVQP